MSSTFDPARLIARLEHGALAIAAAVACVDAEDARWRPDPGSWSILEIVCHLADEESADFRTRTLMTLEDPEADWPPIDPQGWAIERNYQSMDLKEQLDRFLALRRESIAMLRSLTDPDWSRTHTHPVFGSATAGQMLACWCAHDALHLRQLSKRLYQLAQRDGGGVPLDYAGTW